MAALHARCFDDAPRPWSAAEFAEYVADPACLIETADAALGVVRVVADEAELLTICVAPEARRGGRAAGLLDRLIEIASSRGATRMFLEVAEDNAAARALYTRAGFTDAGYRKSYYRRASGPVGARVMARRL